MDMLFFWRFSPKQELDVALPHRDGYGDEYGRDSVRGRSVLVVGLSGTQKRGEILPTAS